MEYYQLPDSQINMTLFGRNIPFIYPGSESEKNIILMLFDGTEYPIIPLEKYYPQNIIDIGGHLGEASIYFLSRFPKANIYSFEPNKKNFSYLQANTKYFPNIKTFNFGLYNENKDVDLYVGVQNSGQSSIIKNEVASQVYDKVTLVKAEEQLKNLGITDISILKIDTEGCEVEILKDLADYLFNTDIIYLEYHSEEDRLEIDKLLSKNFYLFYLNTFQIHLGTVIYISKELANINKQLFYKGSTKK